MSSNLDRYRKDLDALITRGDLLGQSLALECYPTETKAAYKVRYGKKADEILKVLPTFSSEYQAWYSEARAVIKQLLPDRLDDFVRHYEKPKTRKEITYENYRIEDCLQGLVVTRGWEKEKVVGPDAAMPHFNQQLNILRAVKGRFDSSLFDIRQLVQADLFDSELDAAGELAKKKFTRAAGALAGVVLEKHLSQVCDDHAIKITKKAPGINDLNTVLKDAGVIDLVQWRFIQHLADIRNICDHDKKTEPTVPQVNDLISGVAKVVKTVF